MGLLNSTIQQDAAFLADTDGMAETATYTRQVGKSVTVTATVNRIQNTTDQAENNVVSQEHEVFIPHHATKGLTSAPAEGDTIALKAWDNTGSAAAKRFSRILESDAGGWLAVFI